ncbi:AAR090Wp [Eremothecium gossypii ATCC 10895]|uniref:AAR090Wp n=1 Tax=Eremothecium gossypii (strain ATCC 10895 / CBS 109.51 / FGSC 9923 / NRRL Y-1056) TaxID=284811 RepID=Q75EI9_EREGS|nr:AAR090Wp [Eremothecium gossypii ATCC 10895]AAS50455.1 AAR090Wp [Eremothecium gossypii ATCC 10895]
MHFQVLETTSNVEVMEQVLSELEQSPMAPEAALVVLQRVVTAYESLPSRLQAMLRRLCGKSSVLMSQVVVAAQQVRGRPEAGIYQRVLRETLEREPGALAHQLAGGGPTQRRLVTALFFGSRVFNVLAHTLSAAAYVSLLTPQLQTWFEKGAGAPEDAEVLVALLRFHPTQAADALVDLVLCEVRWQIFCKICNQRVGVVQRQLVNGFLLRTLGRLVEASNVQAAYDLLLTLDYRLFNLLELHKVNSVHLQSAIVQVLPESGCEALLKICLGMFGTPDTDDEKRCNLFAILIARMAGPELEKIVHDQQFLSAVTFRLASEDGAVRDRTMSIAKAVAGESLKYEAAHIKLPVPPLRPKGTICFEEITTPRASAYVNNSAVEPQLGALTLEDSDDSDVDSDGERRGREIVFLKDLLVELEAPDLSERGPLRLLKLTIKLVRQKQAFVSEVSFYAPAMLTAVATISNSQSEQDFEEYRINALVSLLVAVPEKVTDLLHLLFQADLSLQQRMAILSALALAARELRGLEDKYVLKPVFDFPTRRLPRNDAPSRALESRESGTSSEGTISAHHTVWRSRKLDSAPAPERPNAFRKHAPAFFFPLAHAWLNGIDLGTFDALFKKHYLSTLRLILAAANPHAEFDRMSELMSYVLQDAEAHDISIE